MTKRVLSCLLALALFAASSVFAHADSTVTLQELASCRRVYAYSGGASAYFYGFYGSTLVSSRVIPDNLTRTVSVTGNILCVCHDDDNAYALVKNSLRTYQVVQMNMNTGACTYTEAGSGKAVQNTSFAAAQGECFLIIVDNTVSYAAGYRNGAEYAYRLPQNIDHLFVKSNAAYAMLDGGAVYRLGGGSASTAHVTDDGSTTLAAAGELTAAAGNATAVLHQDCSCTIRTSGDTPSNSQTANGNPNANSAAGANSLPITDGMLIVSPDTTVSRLKETYGSALTVSDANGNEVSSGKLKTGFSVRLRGSAYPIAVLGDVNGSGTVNSADTELLMDYFVGSKALSPAALRAADKNRDGSTDHRDLVLLARAAGG